MWNAQNIFVICTREMAQQLTLGKCLVISASGFSSWKMFQGGTISFYTTFEMLGESIRVKTTCTRWVSSMIHSARPTVPPVAITIFNWTFLFCAILRRRTDVRTDDMYENSDHYRPWLWVSLVDHLNFQNFLRMSICKYSQCVLHEKGSMFLQFTSILSLRQKSNFKTQCKSFRSKLGLEGCICC